MAAADIFTTVGEEQVTDYLDGTTAVPSDLYVDWGVGGTTAVKGDVALTTPGGESRVIGTPTQPTASVNRFIATITASGAKNIDEMGLFSASTSGNMLVSSTFTEIVLANGDKIEFTIDLTHS